MATVRVVDGAFGIAELFEAALGDEGHRVLIASNGRHALDLLASTVAARCAGYAALSSKPFRSAEMRALAARLPGTDRDHDH